MLENSFVDIFEPRRHEWSNLAWSIRPWNPIVAYKRYERIQPETLKRNVLENGRLQYVIEKLSQEENVSQKELQKRVIELLDEIGFTKDINVIRALCIALVKIIKRMCSKLYLNVPTVDQLKIQMGNNPVLFLPSHRSYADFILMSYVCYTSNIEIPAIAAGMDFHGMWGMGTVLRDTGAFFMRRQFGNDKLYSTTFSEYVREIVLNGDIALEFFIEGTRSRSLKSLPPKFGLLSMALKPLFFGEIPDITIVPISISYDRVMEDKLFASELLGVPKPKETTAGFFKALNIVNEKFGNIYFNFGTPFSAKSYFGSSLNRTEHALKPVSLQSLTDTENDEIIRLGYDVVYRQQQNSVLSSFNLIALILNNNIILGREALSYDALKTDLVSLSKTFESFGANVNCPEDGLDEMLVAHKNLICRTDQNLIKVVKNMMVFGKYDKKRLKGYELSNETMNAALSLVKLQVYVNPTMHFLIGRAITALLIAQGQQGLKTDQLWSDFKWLRRLFAFEFVIYKDRERSEFEESIQSLQDLNVIVNQNNEFSKGVNQQLFTLLCNSLSPFIIAYDTVCEVLIQIRSECAEKEVLSAVQKRVEELFNETIARFIHPYALSLDTISTALQSLTSLNGLERIRRDNVVMYRPITEVLSMVRNRLGGSIYDTNVNGNARSSRDKLQSEDSSQSVIRVTESKKSGVDFSSYFDIVTFICVFASMFVIYLFKSF